MSEGDQESCYCSSIGGFFLFCESLVLKWSESSFISWLVATISKSLHFFGVPEYVEPSPLDTCRAVIAIGWTLFLYYILFGSRHRRRRMRLAKELQLAKEKLHYLQEKLREPSSDQDENGNEKNEIRIFMDGAFDLMHYGHMNAFRLGKSLGTHLVVAINSDVSITKCKGAPLMNDEERISMVEACKFVDEVVPDCPYIMNKEYLDYVIDKYKIDYVIHGDDPCIVDGKDVYATAKKLGKYRSIPRTEGVSTTDIVGRMLLLNKAHHLQEKSKFLTTSRMLQLFSANVKATSTDMRVIYIDGAWDLFHPGHAAILNTARKRGDFLIVGIHGDALVNKRRGMNLPLMNLHERVLSVLGCRFVDDVLIDAPYAVTPEMISSLNISEVVHGTISDETEELHDKDIRYKHAMAANIFTVIESPSSFKIENIVKRIHRNQEVFQAKFERKKKMEDQYYEEKYGESASNGSLDLRTTYE